MECDKVELKGEASLGIAKLQKGLIRLSFIGILPAKPFAGNSSID